LTQLTSNQQSIKSISAIFTPDESKKRLVLPKVRKSGVLLSQTTSNKNERVNQMIQNAVFKHEKKKNTFSSVKLEPVPH
jgi:hypothetical protein